MNAPIVLMGVMAAASVAFVGFLAYRIGILSSGSDFSDLSRLGDNSSLEEDFNDILEFIPLAEVREIIERYAKYDPQIGETVSFVNDQKRFIKREFLQIPQIIRFIEFLRENGLDVDGLADNVQRLWKSVPRFVRSDPSIATGGLTVMISNILKTIPQDEFHELLREKIKYSGSFRRFLQILRSEDFGDFCNVIEKNDVLHHHYFWAKESGIEITFGVELLRNLYFYLTQGII